MQTHAYAQVRTHTCTHTQAKTLPKKLRPSNIRYRIEAASSIWALRSACRHVGYAFSVEFVCAAMTRLCRLFRQQQQVQSTTSSSTTNNVPPSPSSLPPPAFSCELVSMMLQCASCSYRCKTLAAICLNCLLIGDCILSSLFLRAQTLLFSATHSKLQQYQLTPVQHTPVQHCRQLHQSLPPQVLRPPPLPSFPPAPTRERASHPPPASFQEQP